jgi:hypothetical protein
MGTFYNGFTESYYIVLQEYPSTKTSCHSVYTPYAYSAITLIHSIMYIHTHSSFDSFFIEETLVSVCDENNRMFLKTYALVSIEPSLTHILNYAIMYFTHIHIYDIPWSQQWWKRIYIYMHTFHWFLIKIFLSRKKNNMPLFMQARLSTLNIYPTNPGQPTP